MYVLGFRARVLRVDLHFILTQVHALVMCAHTLVICISTDKLEYKDKLCTFFLSCLSKFLLISIVNTLYSLSKK